jgi:hypothetical protein
MRNGPGSENGPFIALSELVFLRTDQQAKLGQFTLAGNQGKKNACSHEIP